MAGETAVTSPPPQEIDNAEEAKSEEKIPETPKVSEKNASELPNLEVSEVSESNLLLIFSDTQFLNIYYDFNSQVQAERKVDEDKTSPHNSVSEASVAKEAEVQENEPSVSTQVLSKSLKLLPDTNSSGLNKTNLKSFFQAQSSVPINLLQAFQKHTLKKHLKCFRQWQKLRKADLSEIARVIDDSERRAIAFDLENHIHALFPIESYSYATLMHEDFIHEVAQKLIAAFKSADAQT